ncbi:hypothetical protein COD13_27525 [Priestia megaterium]|uniref:permease prefix domain 1-containing protein n=1 Tax=Priestia TaxID=2800373 RepID=UPI000BFA6459|nr:MULTISPECIES: permease prefix domain 1-containing protein [Priestia]MDP9725943.1 hypothetical protein [Priestia aryabhattai]PFP08462.1 hypothetical protein COJ90_22195 [Priestia megaterium]PGR77964.1 hypothetical protein COC53_28375 [Priestia megaterium]PGT50152.1 hypothetical protein COD13_27525 [Priestia megaterium]
MKQIEAFVDSVYLNVGGNKQEIQELKAEMKSHLLEAVHELKVEGKTDQEAIAIAIERFGGEKEIRSIIEKLFEVQKIFAKRVLYIAVGFLVLTLSIVGFLWQNAESNAQEISEIATQIADELKDKEVVTIEMKREIERLVESTNYISEVSIYNSKGIRSEGENFVGYNTEAKKPDHQYKRMVWAPKWLGVDLYTYANGDEQWYVEMKQRSFGSLETVVLFVGLAIYWTLFSIWAIINAYHQKRLNIGWIFIFVLFNIFGYLIYLFVGRRIHSNKAGGDFS